MAEEQNWSYPHEWALEEDGHIKNYDLGDIHDGPWCLRCEQHFCRNCHPSIWTEPCGEQDVELVAPPFTPVQRNARLRYLNKLGYIVRGGIIVGKGEPIPPCKPGECKNRVKSRVVIGDGPFKRVNIIYECVVCHEQTTN